MYFKFTSHLLSPYLAEIDDKKEHYKSEKILWAGVLRSLTQELAYMSEMRKMDLEDKIGYISGTKTN